MSSAATQASQRELMELRAQVEELHNHSATIEKESQFYFGKVCPAFLVVAPLARVLIVWILQVARRRGYYPGTSCDAGYGSVQE